MSYHIIEKPAFRIVGIRMKLVDDMEENQKNVPLFWEQTLNDIDRNCNKETNKS